jgi:AAA domain-containing protein
MTEPPRFIGPKPPKPKRVAITTTFSDVPIRSMRYLWRPYLPMGKVVLIAGAPGHGKSQLTALFASLTTRAGFIPSDLHEPARALLLTAEDDLADTVVPRLMATNANLPLISAVNMRTTYPDGLTADGQIKLPDDLPILHSEVKAKRPALAVLDPVVSFIGRSHSTHSNQDVRDVLDPLRSIAETYTTTIVLIVHFNKAAEIREWSARIAESHGFQAIARSVLVLGPDPDDPDGEMGDLKVLALPKTNLIRKVGKSMRLAIESATVMDARGADVETSRLVLLGACDASADDLLMSDDNRRMGREARDWLHDYLGEGWRQATDLKRAGEAEGHGWRTIRRLRSQDCKSAKQPGVAHGPWWVALKATTTPIPGVLEEASNGDTKGHHNNGSLAPLDDEQGSKGTVFGEGLDDPFDDVDQGGNGAKDAIDRLWADDEPVDPTRWWDR